LRKLGLLAIKNLLEENKENQKEISESEMQQHVLTLEIANIGLKVEIANIGVDGAKSCSS
jgi:hypothetical protein